MYCLELPCEEANCHATPTLRRCSRCGIAGLVTRCKHSERSAPIDVSFAADWPNMTCDLCERTQDELCALIEGLLGKEATGRDQTLLRKAINTARAKPWILGLPSDLQQQPISRLVNHVWNEGNWRDHAATLLNPLL
jgi:hypothetical protein